jgi:hypothetical protein
MKRRTHRSRRRVGASWSVLFASFSVHVSSSSRQTPRAIPSAHHPAALIYIKAALAQSGTDKLSRHGYHRFYDQILRHVPALC